MSDGRWSLPGSSQFPDPLGHACRSKWSLWLGLNFLFSGLKEHAKEQCPFPRARAPESSLHFSKLGGQSQGSDSSRATRTSAPSASESPTSPSVQTSIHPPPPRKEVKGSELPQQCPLPSSTSCSRNPAPPRPGHTHPLRKHAPGPPPAPACPLPRLPRPSPAQSRTETGNELSCSSHRKGGSRRSALQVPASF